MFPSVEMMGTSTKQIIASSFVIVILLGVGGGGGVVMVMYSEKGKKANRQTETDKKTRVIYTEEKESVCICA